MLLNLRKNNWDNGFKVKDSRKTDEENLSKIEQISKSAEKYAQWIEGEINKSTKDMYMESVGKYNPRDHLENTIEELVTDSLNQSLTSMMNTLVF